MIALFFIALIWIVFFLGIKLLKDFATTIISCLIIMTIGVYGLTGGIGSSEDLLIQAISIFHLFIGFYWILRSSIELNKERWQQINWRKMKWQKKKKQK
jgi:uncharacterized membrane protein YhaH (DUF805 family)